MKRFVVGLTTAFTGAFMAAVSSPGWSMTAPQGDVAAFALGALLCVLGMGCAMLGAFDY